MSFSLSHLQHHCLVHTIKHWATLQTHQPGIYLICIIRNTLYTRNIPGAILPSSDLPPRPPYGCMRLDSSLDVVVLPVFFFSSTVGPFFFESSSGRPFLLLFPVRLESHRQPTDDTNKEAGHNS